MFLGKKKSLGYIWFIFSELLYLCLVLGVFFFLFFFFFFRILNIFNTHKERREGIK